MYGEDKFSPENLEILEFLNFKLKNFLILKFRNLKFSKILKKLTLISIQTTAVIMLPLFS